MRDSFKDSNKLSATNDDSSPPGGNSRKSSAFWGSRTRGGKGRHLLLVAGSLLLALLIAHHSLPITDVSSAESLSPYEIEKLSRRKAPEFTLKDVNGSSVSLSSLKGKVVLLNFWATWCPPCRDEMPSLEKLHLRMKDKGLAVLSVSVDKSIPAVRDFIGKAPISFPVLLDTKMEVTKSLFKVYTIPTTFLIDRDGTVIEKYFGEQDWTKPEKVKKIESLL